MRVRMRHDVHEPQPPFAISNFPEVRTVVLEGACWSIIPPHHTDFGLCPQVPMVKQAPMVNMPLSLPFVIVGRDKILCERMYIY